MFSVIDGWPLVADNFSRRNLADADTLFRLDSDAKSPFLHQSSRKNVFRVFTRGEGK